MQFDSNLRKLGLNPEIYKKKIKEYSISLTVTDLDNNYLRPEKFLQLCKLLGVTPKKLYDKYYSYVFSDYSRALIKFRENHALSQKEFARISNISPVDIGFFENNLKYPTRAQYLKLKEVLKTHEKRKGPPTI